jgi:exodeoxyribonuclease VII large subunit
VPSPHQPQLLPWELPQRIHSVASLTEAIRKALSSSLADVWVTGEISGVSTGPSGHFYYTLKDRTAQIRCVLFSSAARFCKTKPKNGLAVKIRGRIDVYAQRGEYQLIVDAMELEGLGQLQEAFERLKQKLQAEGLFEASRKKPLPPYPRRIGIVTSLAAAALRDILTVLPRRFPGVHLRVYPALVQGPGSVEQVIAGIDYFSTGGWAEVVIVARGGGSLEDLWTFNEEVVARAIAACRVPLISAIGHETDFTIADFVSDLRAPTPSAAAELVICTRDELLDRLRGCDTHLRQAIRYRVAYAKTRWQALATDRAATLLHRSIGKQLQRVDDAESQLRDAMRRRITGGAVALRALDIRLQRRDVRHRIAEGWRRLDQSRPERFQELIRQMLQVRKQRVAELTGRLANRMEWQVSNLQRRLETLDAQLTHLSPLKVLDRGYAIVRKPSGEVVKDPVEAPEGTDLRIRLAQGELTAKVTDSKQ